ncbi:MAG TPA: helix-turn-helix transcriptional regulator [Dermatophilaceae bacterium]
MPATGGPASLGTGRWPRMDFSGVEDDGQRAACEFVQDVAVAVIAVLTPSGEPGRGSPPSRRQFATSVGVGRDTLIDILKGRRWPRTDRLVRIAHRAGVTIGTL